MKIKKDTPAKQPAIAEGTRHSLRLAPQHIGKGRQFGLAVDARRPIEFFLDNKKYHALHGDHVAAALLANQESFLAGSLLYHRPRGMLGNHFYESNGFVMVGEQKHHGFNPAIAVASLPLSQGMKFYRTRHPNKFSSSQFFNKTREALSAPLSTMPQPLFINKGFMPQSSLSKQRGEHRSLGLMNSFAGKKFIGASGGFWDKFLRQMMGYAPAPLVNPAFQSFGNDPGYALLQDKAHHHGDILIVGGGRATAVVLQQLLAKIGKQKLSIMVVTSDSEAIAMANMTGTNPLAKTDAAAATASKSGGKPFYLDPRITWFFNTTATHAKPLRDLTPSKKETTHDKKIIEVVAVSHHATDASKLGHFLWQQRKNIFHSRAIILATGKSEVMLPFDNNDLPGIVGFDNAVKLLATHGVKPGNHAVVITNNDSVYYRLAYLHAAGVDISAVVDIRKKIAPHLLELANRVGVTVYEFYYPKRARALYNQAAPSIFPNSLGKVVKILGRVVRTDNPNVASLLAVQQLHNPAPGATWGATSSNKNENAEGRQEEATANKIILARPDQTDEALSAETEKIFNSDCLLVSGGFQPRLNLFTQLLPKNKREGDYLIWSDALQCYLPAFWPPQVFLVGSVGGCMPHGLSGEQTKQKPKAKKSPEGDRLLAMAQTVAQEVQDFLYGKKNAEQLTAHPRHVYHGGFNIMPYRFLPDADSLGRHSFIDYQYDIKLKHLHNTFQAGYHTPFGLKHYSKLGFGFDRGIGSLALGLAHLYENKAQEISGSLSFAGARVESQGAVKNNNHGATDTMTNIIKENNIFDELHGLAYPTTLASLASLPLDGRRFFNQSTIRGETPLYPLAHRPKFFDVIMHPENNISNDHGAYCLLQDGKKIADHYPYHEGDEKTGAIMEEKERIMDGLGFVDGSNMISVSLLGKKAIDFLQFLSATKLNQTKLNSVGAVTMLNPQDGFIIARGRYIIRGDRSVLLSLPLGATGINASRENNHIVTLIKSLARAHGFAVAVVDDTEQWATIRLVGRGVAIFASQFLNNNLLEKSFGKNFTLPRLFDGEQKEKCENAARQLLVDALPLHQYRYIHWHGMGFYLLRRRVLPGYYIGGQVGDIEITCAAHQAIGLYQALWQATLSEEDSAPSSLPFAQQAEKKNKQKVATVPTVGAILQAAAIRPFALGYSALDYWRLLKGDSTHGSAGEIDGIRTLHDMRLEEKMKAEKFAGREQMLQHGLLQKNRPRLCGFIATMGGASTIETGHHRGVIRAGSIVQEIDKEPLSQGHGIGHITTASYCPVRKQYIAMGYLMPSLDPLSGKWKDPFGKEVMIADPLFKNYQAAVVVPHHQLGMPKEKE